MSWLSDILLRVRLRLSPFRPGELAGEAGKQWTADLRTVARQTRNESSSGDVKERLAELAGFGFEAGKGYIDKPHQEAVESAMNAELARAQAEFQKRTMAARVQQAEAESQSAAIDTQLKQEELRAKRLENLQRLIALHRSLGATIVFKADGSIDVVRLRDAASEVDGGSNLRS